MTVSFNIFGGCQYFNLAQVDHCSKMIFKMELCDCVHDVTFGISYQVFCFNASIPKVIG
jgi:hypothetical protein